jgi:cytochrome oxidase Cu insertion factor (SCO1/SenC/PrrC family)
VAVRHRLVYMRAMPKPAQGRANAVPILIAAMIAILAVTGIVLLRVAENRPAGGEGSGISIGGPFTLTDQTGATVTEKTYDGSYRLIYFGYTFCPDACPTELAVMAQALDAMGPAGAKVQPIFITIDPDRDTVPQLKNYVPLFDKRLVGLTGTQQQIAAIAKEYKVYYSKADQPGIDANSYGMNHSSFVYLMDPDGRFLTVFSSDTDADKMAAEIRRCMAAPAG